VGQGAQYYFPHNSSTTGTKDLTRFFVKITNANRRSEGKAQECVGLVSIDNKTYRSVWQYDYAADTFGEEALLLVFYIDKNCNTVNFVNYQQSRQIIESKPHDECIKNSITIRLECSRGLCPKPLTEKIKNIINEATRV
jgi:hypothetical protein